MPVLDPVLQYSLSLFYEIDNTERTFEGGTPLPISLGSFTLYAQLHGFNREDFERLWRHFRVLDTVYLKHQEKRRQAAEVKSKSGARRLSKKK